MVHASCFLSIFNPFSGSQRAPSAVSDYLVRLPVGNQPCRPCPYARVPSLPPGLGPPHWVVSTAVPSRPVPSSPHPSSPCAGPPLLQMTYPVSSEGQAGLSCLWGAPWPCCLTPPAMSPAFRGALAPAPTLGRGPSQTHTFLVPSGLQHLALGHRTSLPLSPCL